MADVNDRPLGVPYGLLDPGEQVYAEAQADGGAIVVTDRRVAVAVMPERFHLDVPFEALRRIQFDIERERPEPRGGLNAQHRRARACRSAA